MGLQRLFAWEASPRPLSYPCKMDNLGFRQREGLLSTLPLTLNAVASWRTLDTSSPARLFPFSAPHLETSSGTLFGIDLRAFRAVPSLPRKHREWIEMRTPRLFLGIFGLALILLLLLPACDGSDERTDAPPSEREALVALYNATGGPNWKNNTNWLSDVPPGEWLGVTADDKGRVTELSLFQNELSGEIPAELGNLANLSALYLDENQLSGEIPAELGNPANLSALYLDENQLSGEIPAELGNPANLSVLGLSRNQLSGEIPVELGNLANLSELGLCENQLSGEIPAELGNLANLSVLGLFQNQLSGEIPAELGNLANLTVLGLNGNQLSGEIPAELGQLFNLEWLYLSENQLSGEIPAELGKTWPT